MGRAPCCEKDSVKRGPWTPEEDAKLLACIAQHGTGSWRTLPKKAGLQRCGKSCRLRWTNYLRPDLKHGRFSDHEEQLIVKLHAALGSRWSLIAAQLPGRTDNDVKNYWNTRLKKKLCEMGIDPITHKPISQLLADLAGSVALPKGGQIAEAALGCFKDDMLNVLMRKRPDWQLEGSVSSQNPNPCFLDMPNSSSSRFFSAQKAPFAVSSPLPVDPVVQKIKQSLSSAVQSRTMPDQADFYTQEEIPIQMGANRSNFAPKQSEFYNQFFLPGSKSMAMAPDSSYLSSAFLNSSKLGLPFGSIREAPSPNWDEELSGTSAAPAPNTSLHLHMGSNSGSIPASEAQNSQIFLQQQESDSVSCQSLAMEVPPECQEARIPWSPSSGSSCSSTSLAFEGVLSSDVQLWDFSELTSIMS